MLVKTNQKILKKLHFFIVFKKLTIEKYKKNATIILYETGYNAGHNLEGYFFHKQQRKKWKE